MEFKEKVLYVRARMNMTQEILAKELNVTNLTVHRWENGINKPTKKTQMAFDQYCKDKNIEVK